MVSYSTDMNVYLNYGSLSKRGSQHMLIAALYLDAASAK